MLLNSVKCNSCMISCSYKYILEFSDILTCSQEIVLLKFSYTRVLFIRSRTGSGIARSIWLIFMLQVSLDDSILCINTTKRSENVMITFNPYERYRPVNLHERRVHERHVHEMCLQESLYKQVITSLLNITFLLKLYQLIRQQMTLMNPLSQKV